MLAKTVTKVMLCVSCIAITLYPQPKQANAMIQRPEFQALWTYIDAQGYTSAQFENVTKDQVQNALGLSNDQIKRLRYFWHGMAEIVMRRLLEKEKLAEIIVLKNAIENFRPGVVDWQYKKVQDVIRSLAHLTLGGDPNDL